MPIDRGDVRSLASLPPGATGTLGPGGVVRAHGLRLAQLGLRVGAQVTVLSRTSGGGRLVAVGSTRIGVDRETCRRLEVSVPGLPA